MNPLMIKSYEAEAAVEGYRVVAFSDAAASSMVSTAAANTDPIIGTADAMGAGVGDMLDVHCGGLGSVKLGGTVTAGAPLTSDANGAAIVATASAGSIVRVFGYANEPGVDGDVISYTWAPALLNS